MVNGKNFRRWYRLSDAATNAYHGELSGIALAIHHVRNTLKLRPGQKVYIISDCQAAVEAALNPRRDNLLSTLIFRDLQLTPQIENLVWIPSHLGIDGNEVADELANLGASQDDYVIALPYDLNYWKHRIKDAMMKNWAYFWKHDVWLCKSLHKLLPDLNKHPGFLLGNNRLDKQLAQIRMDYVSLNGFKKRHGLADVSSCDACLAMLDEKRVQSSEILSLNVERILPKEKSSSRK